MSAATHEAAPIGRRYGSRTVIGNADRSKNGTRQWLVRCVCGDERAVRTDSLARSDSCGCLRYREWDLRGRTFGRLTVTEQAESRAGQKRWLCRCTCGVEKIVYGTHLTRGNTTSCGCSTLPAVVSYRVAHKRVARRLGSASSHRCVDCGDTASQWSYDHADPNQLTQQMVTRHGTPWVATYSTKPEHYEARCRPCHWKFDNLPDCDAEWEVWR